VFRLEEGVVSVITFDTLAYAKKLKSAGFTEQQAEVQAEALADIIEDQMASKHDLKSLETVFAYELKQAEMRLTIRLGAIIVGAVGVFATLVKFL
jgi:uncharacterized membrane protein YheB (UPF0754 family)